MSTITHSEVNEPGDEVLRGIAVRIAREAELAMEKVAASHSRPDVFKVTGMPHSVEAMFATRFAQLTPAVQQGASHRALLRMRAPALRRARRFGDLARVDLTRPLEEQFQRIPSALQASATKAWIKDLMPSQLPPAVTPAPSTDKLELRIHKVKCLDETDGFLGSEAGSDEIDVGGTTVDESGETKKVNAFRVGSHFDDGDHVTYSPPRQFTWFNLNEGTAFPKSYFVTLVLAEADMGGLPDFLNKLLDWAKAKVTAALAAALGGAIGASGGPVGAIIGAAVGFVVGLVFDLFKSIWEDDIFKPATLRVNIPSLGARWPGERTDSPEGVVTYTGHGGKYQVTYDWRLFH